MTRVLEAWFERIHPICVYCLTQSFFFVYALVAQMALRSASHVQMWLPQEK